MGRTTLWKCYHKRHHDGLAPAETHAVEGSAPWPQLLRFFHHWHVVARRSVGLRALPVALILAGGADEAPYGGSPLVELFHSRRKVEEQLCALELLLVWAAAKAAWTVTRFDF